LYRLSRFFFIVVLVFILRIKRKARVERKNDSEELGGKSLKKEETKKIQEEN
jgi:hypothetical protein